MKTGISKDYRAPMEVAIISIGVYLVLLQVSFALAKMINSTLILFPLFSRDTFTTDYLIEAGRNVAFFVVVVPLLNMFRKWESVPLIHIWVSYKCNRRTLLCALISGTAIVALSWFFALAVYPKENPLMELPATKGPFNWRLTLFVFLITTSLVSICEEYLFRGLLYRSLRRSISVLKAGAVSAFVYSGMHVLTISDASAFKAIHALIYHFLFGFAAVYVYEIARSLNGPILMHITNNTLVTLIHYLLNVIPFEELGVELN